jgi:hypothetical protein
VGSADAGEDGSGLPLVEEVGDGGGLHVTHIPKLAGLLGVEDFAVGVENGERRDAFINGNAVVFGEI